MKMFMPRDEQLKVKKLLMNDLDMVHIGVVSDADMNTEPFECNLAEILKPPAERFVILQCVYCLKLFRYNSSFQLLQIV